MEPAQIFELPRHFVDAPVDHLVVLIADMLDRLMAHNDQIPLSPESLTRFHSRSPPTISVLDYLRRIVRYANVEKTCLLITLHYIDQVCARIPKFFLSSLTCHRFVISAIVVSSKALCDAFCTNNHYAKVGGIRVGELNLLEKEFLSLIDWRLTSTEEVLNEYYLNLVRTHSTGRYTLAAPTSPSEVDSDMDSVRSISPHTPDPVLAAANFLPVHLPQSSDSTVSVPTHDKTPAVILRRTHTHHPRYSDAPSSASSSRTAVEPSAVLRDKATLAPKESTGPTLEQNMAFAALRSPSSTSSLTASASSPTTTSSPLVRKRSVPPSPVLLQGSPSKLEKRVMEALEEVEDIDHRPSVRPRFEDTFDTGFGA